MKCNLAFLERIGRFLFPFFFILKPSIPKVKRVPLVPRLRSLAAPVATDTKQNAHKVFPKLDPERRFGKRSVKRKRNGINKNENHSKFCLEGQEGDVATTRSLIFTMTCMDTKPVLSIGSFASVNATQCVLYRYV